MLRLVGCLAGLGAASVPASAQLAFSLPATGYELSPAVQVDRADDNALRALQRINQHLADQQWAEAVDTLCQVMEQSGEKLFAITPQRFISLRDYCHLRLASLPPEALGLYRSRVDPQANRWYEEALPARDSGRLLRLLDQAFASSWGDNALNALAEIALESGDHAAARAFWEKMLPFEQPGDVPRTWLGVPDTELDLAGIRARLVLTSILEGSTSRARQELARLAKLHPNAKGRLGGEEVNYAAALAALLADSASWPEPRQQPDWPTFAGSPSRNQIAPRPPDVADVVWRAPLRPVTYAGSRRLGPSAALGRVADDPSRPLSFHPVIVGDLVLVNVQVAILALDRRTGRPAWGNARPVIYEDPYDEAVRQRYNPADSLGVPRFTLTVFHDRLYARLGPAWTARGGAGHGPVGPGYLVCLDLAAQGRLLWAIPPEEGYAFEGSPVCDGKDVFVALRRSLIQPQIHVACYDAQTGQRRWQQFVCAADSPARGLWGEITHTLLTLHRDTLFCNTNLGAVAALAARDGRLLWVTTYPRALKGDLQRPAAHLGRDLTPCLYDRGRLIVAPSDSPEIFALDAATGQPLWHTGPGAEEAIHLLGVAGDWLIASGGRLYWIALADPEPGRIKRVWPEGPDRPGFGRGVLAGDCVLWPTRQRILVFDQLTGRLEKEIALVPRGLTGGNLLVAEGQLLVATGTELVALGLARRTPAADRGPSPLAASRR